MGEIDVKNRQRDSEHRITLLSYCAIGRNGTIVRQSKEIIGSQAAKNTHYY